MVKKAIKRLLNKAFCKMVEGQVQAFKMDTKKIPSSLQELIDKDYLPKGAKCPDGTQLNIDSTGKVIVP